MKKASLFVLLLLPTFTSAWSTAANTATQVSNKRLPELADFSVHQRLQVTGNAAAYRFTLPPQTYHAIPAGDLGYIGVFNQQGNLIPWQRIPTPPKVVKKTEIIPLGFFDGEQQRRVQPATERLSIYRNKKSVSVNVDLSASFEDRPGGITYDSGTLGVYYLDLSQLPDFRRLRKLDFGWQTEQRSLIFDAKVSVSKDFKRWQTLGSGRLVDLHQGTRSVLIKQVAIDSPNHPYLRIQFSKPQQTVPPLQSVTGHFISASKTKANSPWQRVRLHSITDARGYEFVTGGDYAVSQLRILSPSENSIGEVSVYVWNRQQWVFMARENIAQLQQTAPELQKSVIDLSTTSVQVAYSRKQSLLRGQRWRLIFSKESTDYLNSPPEVAFTYHLEDLAFIRQGNSPFTLAYGLQKGLSNQLSWPDWRNNPLFPDTGLQSEQVVLGEVAIQGPKPIPYQTYHFFSTTHLFWVGMIIFVGLLMALAIHLFREIGNKTEQ